MKHKIDALTGLRFFAASAIVLHHMRDFPGISPGFLNDAILPQGVSVFFVLSGFILTYVYPALDKQGETSRFFLARFARVWPAHVVVLVAVLVVLRRNPAAGDLESGLLLPLIANTTLTHAFVPLAPFFFSFNAVSWSISTEVGFYLLFPLLIRNFAATWHWKLLLALGVSVSAALLASHFRLQGHVGPSLSVPLEGIVYVNPLARIFEFTLGMTAALGWREIRKQARTS
jgi:peptidoglycan/LPS O-acetylase OafA/YrhL